MSAGLPRDGLTGTGWTVLAGGAALLAAGLSLGYPVLTGLAVAAGVALLAAGVSALVRPRLKITRTVRPDRVTVGEPAHGTIEVYNTGRLPAPSFDAVERLDGAPLPVTISGLGARQRRTLHYPIATPYRGLVRLGPVIVERRDPLGLIRRSAPLAGETQLWVRPRVRPVRALPIGVVLDFEGRLTDNAPKGSMAFASLREYVPGDDPRQIHWRSTARMGKLVVREHVDTSEPTAVIGLDTRDSVLAPAAFEEAVEFAASVAVAAHRVGHQVTLAALDEDRRGVEQAGGYDLLDRLAAVRQTGTADPGALLAMLERSRGGGALVVVTGAVPGLVARVATQRRRFGRVVVVQLGDEGGISRRPGLTVLRASSVTEAAKLWNKLVAGGPA